LILSSKEKKVKVTNEYYEANIPECCILKTFQEHKEELMLCWVLLHEMGKRMDTKNRKCGKGCDYHVDHDPNY